MFRITNFYVILNEIENRGGKVNEKEKSKPPNQKKSSGGGVH